MVIMFSKASFLKTESERERGEKMIVYSQKLNVKPPVAKKVEKKNDVGWRLNCTLFMSLSLSVFLFACLSVCLPSYFPTYFLYLFVYVSVLISFYFTFFLFPPLPLLRCEEAKKRGEEGRKEGGAGWRVPFGIPSCVCLPTYLSTDLSVSVSVFVSLFPHLLLLRWEKTKRRGKEGRTGWRAPFCVPPCVCLSINPYRCA